MSVQRTRFLFYIHIHQLFIRKSVQPLQDLKQEDSRDLKVMLRFSIQIGRRVDKPQNLHRS